jgi:hypothetical protein
MNLFQQYSDFDTSLSVFAEPETEEYFDFTEVQCPSRIQRWVDFFEEHANCNVIFLQDTLSLLPAVIRRNWIMCSQTEFELELSFSFYKAFFYSKRFLFVMGTVSAEKLLVLSLIYSRYYGVFLVSVKREVPKIKSSMMFSELNQLFHNLLIKYDKPKFLVNHFELMNQEEFEMLLAAGCGKNLKHHTVFQGKISSADFSKIMNFSMVVQLKDRFFLRAAIFVLLEKTGVKAEFCNSFVLISKVFRDDPEFYLENISYWQQAVKLAWDSKDFLDFNITNTVDYLDEHVYAYEPNFLKRRTPQGFHRAINEWHNRVQFIQDYDCRGLRWKVSKEHLDLYFDFEKGSYRCLQIKNGRELFQEGEVLHHCVATYYRSLLAGSCRIWSLQQKKADEFLHFITIEESDGVVIQARKKDNKLPNKAQLKIVEDWAARMSFTVDLYKNS